MRYIALAALLLAACSGGGNNPTSPNPPFSGSISPQAAWRVTESSAPRPLTNGTFAFQEAHSALQIYDSYVEVPLPVSLNAAQTFTLTFTITGDDPAFVNDTKDNTCGGPPALSLLLRQANDMGSPYARWYSVKMFEVPLALGTHTVSVALSAVDWIAVDGTSNATWYANAIDHLGSIGFVLGGGCFAGHGVAVVRGSAQLTINSVTIE
jgi:hypothetical protein